MEQTSVMVLTFFLLFSLLTSVQGSIRTNEVKEREGMKDERGCSKRDIEITQGPTEPLPSGIPTYTVEISNVCSTGCTISNIHVSCGMFSSATVINPNVFKRLAINDCLVNNGEPLSNGAILSFKYANIFPYTLSVSSVSC